MTMCARAMYCVGVKHSNMSKCKSVENVRMCENLHSFMPYCVCVCVCVCARVRVCIYSQVSSSVL